MMETKERTLARSLPDVPRWLWVRSMLLSGRCEVLGLEETGSEPSFVARELEESEDQWICAVGRPLSEAMEEAARRRLYAERGIALAFIASWAEEARGLAEELGLTC